MDLDLTGTLAGFLPYISYVVDLFTRLLEIFASYLGIDISIPASDEEEIEEVIE